MAVPTLAPAAPPPTPVAARKGRLRHHAWFTPYLLVAPFLVLLCMFVLWPAVYGFFISLHDWDYALDYKPFVGGQNYANLFDPDSLVFENFWNGMKNTLIFVVASVPFLVLVPLLVALLLNRKFVGRTFFRAMIFAPYVLGIAVIGVLFRYLLDTQFGVINAFLGIFGIPAVPWTQSQPWAWIALVAMTLWWTMGFNTIIYLAGLQSLPAEQYEAAELDGAGKWASFRYITLPGLRMVLIFIVTTTILASANMFGQAYLVTGGGPGDSTRTAIMVMTEEGLRRFQMGSASAMSYFLAVLLAIIAVINFWIMRERDS